MAAEEGLRYVAGFRPSSRGPSSDRRRSHSTTVAALLFVLAVLWSTGCSSPAPAPSQTASQSGTAAEQAAQAQQLAQAKEAIRALVTQRQTAVSQHDRNTFLATVDPENTTYFVEQGHWYDDAVQTVAAYSLQLRDVQLTAPGEALAQLSLSLTLKSGDTQGITCPEVYRLRDGSWKDSDYAFKELRQGHIAIKHMARPVAAAATPDIETANVTWLEQTFDWQPAADLEVKIYPNQPIFANSIKPGLMKSSAKGWSEVGEAIKYWTDEDTAPPATVLLHETAHHMLSELTNDNASYWLQEGLATWTQSAESGQFDMAGVRMDLGGTRLLYTLPQLETLSIERTPVHGYYGESMLVVKYLVDRYGMKKFRAITDELAKHPANPASNSEKVKATDDLTRQAISKVLAIPFDQFAREWYQWASVEIRQAK